MQVANRKIVLELLDLMHISPLKRYGQNFLINEDIAAKIVDQLSIQQGENVVEIGPGLGALTHYLSLHDSNLTLVEIDKTTTKFLSDTYEKFSKVTVINKDIMRFDFSTIGENIKVIGNLPYYITTPIIEELIKNSDRINCFVIMVQHEVIARFRAKPGDDTYGPLSIMLALLGRGELAFKVSADNFFPRPAVASAVYTYHFDHKLDSDNIRKLYRLITTLFNNRRKTIMNNLTSYLKDKEQAEAILGQLKVDSQLRPEQLPPTFYQQLMQLLDKGV